MKGYTNEEITERLSDHGVIDCRRIIKEPKSSQPVLTAILILTLDSATLPDRINIRRLTESVLTYIPLQDAGLFDNQNGHSGAKCHRALPVCVRCGLDVEGDHNPDNCQLPINCIHCHQPHCVSTKISFRYLFRKEMLTIKTKEHFTFSEARAKARLTFNYKILQWNCRGYRAKSEDFFHLLHIKFHAVALLQEDNVE